MPKLQAEALDQLRDRVRSHLQAVPLAQFCDRFRARHDHTTNVRELLEEALETGRRDDLEDPARLVAGVPERVPLVARLVDEITRTSLDHVVAQQRPHPTLEDEAVLVLTRVAVNGRREGVRGHRMLDEREALTRLHSVDQETDADAAEEPLAPGV